ncbi:MAG: flavodoxin family protein [Methanomassiliicoccaceae archaeon]|jgi:multimeric flavodoxin WrbA|nr:flavodoxin family protein [Methanomassiliicoccaceae archaeon]
MKVTIFNGSPRKDDSTASATSLLAEMMAASGADVNEHFLYYLNIKGCLTCGIGGRGKENACTMVNELISSDAAVLASPIYMWNMADPLKSLMEVLCAICRDDSDAVRSLEGKKMAAVFATDDGNEVAEAAAKPLRALCDNFRIRYTGTLTVPFTDRDKISEEQFRISVRNFADMIMKV